MEKWVLINKKADITAMSEQLKIDPVTARILANRGLDSAEKARAFLNGTLADLHDPRLLMDAEKAASLIREGLERGLRFAVASDYDADGLFGGMILQEALEALGAEVTVLTPDRIEEGYGLNTRIVDEALAFGAAILITCDNGISAAEAVKYARDKGMTVIVTDHHEVPKADVPDPARKEAEQILPPAHAVVDPKRTDCSYPFPGICGAVVALKLMMLLYASLGKDASALLEGLLPYAAIATVADVMDLVDENRILVKEGLKRLQHTENPGLKALIALQGLQDKPLSAYHLGFILGPCFNAAGRLETVDAARALLMAKDDEEALPLAGRLIELNSARKTLTARGVEEAEEKIREEGLAQDKVLVVYLPDCHESVIGIIAGRLKESYNRPVYVLAGNGEICKGSGRSIEAYPMFDRLSEVKELLEKFGGHPMAAGFSLKKENIGAFREKINEKSDLTEDDLCTIIRLDAAMPPEYVSFGLIREWEKLAPFGKGFEKPLFGRTGLLMSGIRVLGQKRNVVRIRFDGESGESFQGIWFGDAAVFEAFVTEHYGKKAFTMLERYQAKFPVALSYVPRVNEYDGKRSIQFEIRSFQTVS